MNRVGRRECWEATAKAPSALTFVRRPIQAGLGKCPWRVAVASILLCRTRKVQAAPVLKELFARWPTAGDLARADVDELEALLRPLGLHRQKARQLVRFSWQYLGEWWDDIGELAGVGAYVREAVGLVCFSYTDLSCGDRALTEYADEVRRTESLPGRRD